MREVLEETREIDIYLNNECEKTINVVEVELFALQDMKKKILESYRYQGS